MTNKSLLGWVGRIINYQVATGQTSPSQVERNLRYRRCAAVKIRIFLKSPYLVCSAEMWSCLGAPIARPWLYKCNFRSPPWRHSGEGTAPSWSSTRSCPCTNGAFLWRLAENPSSLQRIRREGGLHCPVVWSHLRQWRICWPWWFQFGSPFAGRDDILSRPISGLLDAERLESGRVIIFTRLFHTADHANQLSKDVTPSGVFAFEIFYAVPEA